MIKPDSEKGKELGFTSDKFSEDSYLWEDGKLMFISFIVSKQEHKGNLRALFDAIEAKGYSIVVPTPMDRMIGICERRGMKLCKVAHDGEALYAMINPKDFEPWQ